MHRLALWEYQHNHEGRLPDDMDATSELGQIANSILATSDVNRQVLTSVPLDLIECALLRLICLGF
jgi:ubiquitin-like 1-activating enzyme E1 A